MKDRKACYDKYVKVRATEERKERIQKSKERKEDFKKLLEEVISSARYKILVFFKSGNYTYLNSMHNSEKNGLWNMYHLNATWKIVYLTCIISCIMIFNIVTEDYIYLTKFSVLLLVSYFS